MEPNHFFWDVFVDSGTIQPTWTWGRLSLTLSLSFKTLSTTYKLVFFFGIPLPFASNMYFVLGPDASQAMEYNLNPINS